jgi:hypothetical protein
MTIFELVKIALDELYAEAHEAYGNGTDTAIKDRMAYLTKSYFNLTDTNREPVDYKDPATRFVTKFWAQLFENAKPGALFVYTDNRSDAFDENFDKICKKAGLKTLISGGGDKFWPRFSEQASELVEYNEKFNHNPKVQAKLSYRVLRKD